MGSSTAPWDAEGWLSYLCAHGRVWGEGYLAWVGVAAERQVGYHLLVGELVPLRALDDPVQHQHVAVALAAGGVTVRDLVPWGGGNVPPLAPGEKKPPHPAKGSQGLCPGGDTWRGPAGRPAARRLG